MNRRGFLKTAGAALGAAIGASLVPSWLFQARPQINLQAFCKDYSTDIVMDRPFTQFLGEHPFRFGTDSRICVSVPGAELDMKSEEKRLPPVDRLFWRHDTLTQWRPWPKADYLLADKSPCPARNELLDALPADIRRAVVLCHEMGYEEESVDPTKITAATLCGVTGRTIRSRIRQAAAYLAQFNQEDL